MIGRLFSLFRRRRLDADLDIELRHHLDALEAEHRARGLSADEARLAAARDMGGVTQAREAYRDQHGLPRIEDLWRDVRFGLRSLRRTPGATAAVIVTLAIGIGANTAIFAVVYGVLLKPLPFPDAGRLISVVHTTRAIGGELPSAPYLYFTYRDENKTFEHVGLWWGGTANITGNSGAGQNSPEQVASLFVTADIFPALGVSPMIGRAFSRKDDEPGAALTVILSHGYWRRRFGGDASVLGRSVTMGGLDREIIGVMPPSFRFLDRAADVIVPFQFDRSQVLLGRYIFQGLARLRPGVTIEQASADVARMLPIAIDAFAPPPGYTRDQFKATGIGPNLRPLKQDVVGTLGKRLWVLMGALVLALLIACANVANLLLVRTEGRQQELAVRAALGAGWGRIARELLVESTLLGLLGGVAGVAVAYAGLQALFALRPANLPRLDEIAIDPAVLVFTLGISILAGLVFGLLPVLTYANPQLAPALRTRGRAMGHSRTRTRAQSALVVAQVAIALVLLVCSGLMIRTFQALSHVNPGFTRPDEVQLISVMIGNTDAPEPEQVTRMQQAITDRIAAVPGVTSVAFADIPPLGGGSDSDTVLFTDGTIPAPDTLRPLRRFEFISPGFFGTIGMPLVAGRDLTWDDLYGKRMVVLVSENLARDDWGSAAEAIGKRVRVSPDDPWREIVGVFGNLHDNGVHQPAPPIVFFPALMDRFGSLPTASFRSVTFVVRSPRAGNERFVKEVQQAVWQVSGNLPVAQIRTLDDMYRRSLAPTSFTLVMIAAAGALGLLLGLVGIYSVIAYAVSQRTQEIGIRLALGAQTGQLRRLFVNRGLTLTGIGIVLGLAAAAGFTRLMSSLLFGVNPLDPLTYTIVTVIVIAVAVVAAYVPARRATRIDPLHALRAG